MLRLLQKQEISKLQADEKARETAEGLKIARKVDSLRELRSNTEKELEDYRRDTLSVIQKEILELDKKRQILNSEVSKMQSKLDSMLPGMETKRELLIKKEKEIKEIEKLLKEREQEVKLGEIDIAEAKKEADNSLKRSQMTEYSTSLKLKSIEDKEYQTSLSLNRAKTIENTAIKQKTEQEAILGEKSVLLSQKERELSVLQDNLNKKDKELERERIKLADRNAMLDRNLERLKLKKLRNE